MDREEVAERVSEMSIETAELVGQRKTAILDELYRCQQNLMEESQNMRDSVEGQLGGDYAILPEVEKVLGERRASEYKESCMDEVQELHEKVAEISNKMEVAKKRLRNTDSAGEIKNILLELEAEIKGE